MAELNATDILIAIGTGSLTVLAFLIFAIANSNGYRRYGREALFAWVFMCLMLVAVRVGRDYFGLLSPGGAVSLASIGYVATVLILAQIAFILRHAEVKS